MRKNNIDIEDLLVSAISALLEKNGGSLEQALDDMGVKNQDQRNYLAVLFNWY